MAVFGNPNLPNKTRPESGRYPPEKGFHPERRGVEPEDKLLCYCAGTFDDPRKAIAGVGTVKSVGSVDGLVYDYHKLSHSISLDKVRAAITREENKKFSHLHIPANWLFPIEEKSFERILRYLPESKPPRLRRDVPSRPKRRLIVLLERDEDGYYVASVPELRGCHTQGKTVDEAIENIRDAALLCLDLEQDEDDVKLEFIGVHTMDV